MWQIRHVQSSIQQCNDCNVIYSWSQAESNTCNNATLFICVTKIVNEVLSPSAMYTASAMYTDVVSYTCNTLSMTWKISL